MRYKAKASACLTCGVSVFWLLLSLLLPAWLNFSTMDKLVFCSISGPPRNHWAEQSINTTPAEISVNTLNVCNALTIKRNDLCPRTKPSRLVHLANNLLIVKLKRLCVRPDHLFICSIETFVHKSIIGISPIRTLYFNSYATFS